VAYFLGHPVVTSYVSREFTRGTVSTNFGCDCHTAPTLWYKLSLLQYSSGSWGWLTLAFSLRSNFNFAIVSEKLSTSTAINILDKKRQPQLFKRALSRKFSQQTRTIKVKVKA